MTYDRMATQINELTDIQSGLISTHELIEMRDRIRSRGWPGDRHIINTIDEQILKRIFGENSDQIDE